MTCTSAATKNQAPPERESTNIRNGTRPKTVSTGPFREPSDFAGAGTSRPPAFPNRTRCVLRRRMPGGGRVQQDDTAE